MDVRTKTGHVVRSLDPEAMKSCLQKLRSFRYQMRSALGGDNLDTTEESAQKGIVPPGEGLALSLSQYPNGSVSLSRYSCLRCFSVFFLAFYARLPCSQYQDEPLVVSLCRWTVDFCFISILGFTVGTGAISTSICQTWR